MKLYIAATSSPTSKKELPAFLEKYKPMYLLESFYYAEEPVMNYVKSGNCKSFILDSGAFTFMNAAYKKSEMNVDFLKYTHKYCDFINKHGIELFFEMDVDRLTSLEYAEKLRAVIEKETGKKPIPVWHIDRGKQYFIDMCRSYPYVAVGDLVLYIKKSQHKYLNWFCDTAHKYGCKIHGLGFTPSRNAGQYHFDSIDSSSWNVGVRYGHLYVFKGDSVELIKHPPGMKGKREPLKHQNYSAWVMYQKYLDKGSI